MSRSENREGEPVRTAIGCIKREESAPKLGLAPAELVRTPLPPTSILANELSAQMSAEEEAPKAPLAIEAPAESDAIKLNVATSEVVSLFDQLGPTIVSAEGTLSRIGNWHEMDDAERMRVLRVLGKRNQIRLEGLRDAAEKQENEDAAKGQVP
ncbi:hypothetical protein P7C70_g4453, partial [Phenoliferia sp. Uapishka_3]